MTGSSHVPVEENTSLPSQHHDILMKGRSRIPSGVLARPAALQMHFETGQIELELDTRHIAAMPLIPGLRIKLNVPRPTQGHHVCGRVEG